MLINFIKITLIITAFLYTHSYAIDTSQQEKTCAELGFKRKTEAHANCVIELVTRNGTNSRATTITNSNPDDTTCRNYGFKAGTTPYAECRQKLDLAKQQAYERQREYEEQRRQYDAQVAAIKKEKDRERGLKQMELGLRMMGGQPIQDAVRETAGMPPLPKPPGPVNQTIVMPGGKMVNCTTTGTVTHCF